MPPMHPFPSVIEKTIPQLIFKGLKHQAKITMDSVQDGNHTKL